MECLLGVNQALASYTVYNRISYKLSPATSEVKNNLAFNMLMVDRNKVDKKALKLHLNKQNLYFSNKKRETCILNLEIIFVT